MNRNQQRASNGSHGRQRWARLMMVTVCLLVATGCGPVKEQPSTVTLPTTATASLDALGVTEVSQIDAATFTKFFETKASQLDELSYVASYSMPTTTVVVDRAPERLIATITTTAETVVGNTNRTVPAAKVTIRLSPEAALVCQDECVSIADWLADPSHSEAPELAGVSTVLWWDLFVETGAHDPSTVSFIPQVATSNTSRVFFSAKRSLAATGSASCAGYLREAGEPVLWCFTTDGIWATGPSQVATLDDVTIR